MNTPNNIQILGRKPSLDLFHVLNVKALKKCLLLQGVVTLVKFARFVKVAGGQNAHLEIIKANLRGA
jgi:hypothetical protein